MATRELCNIGFVLGRGVLPSRVQPDPGRPASHPPTPSTTVGGRRRRRRQARRQTSEQCRRASATPDSAVPKTVMILVVRAPPRRRCRATALASESGRALGREARSRGSTCSWRAGSISRAIRVTAATLSTSRRSAAERAVGGRVDQRDPRAGRYPGWVMSDWGATLSWSFRCRALIRNPVFSWTS
jgi:hypothetical protein